MTVSAKTLGPYQLEREIGRGAFGNVYQARHQTSGKVKAVKILLPWAQKDDELRKRLRREAKLAGLLKSQHSVRIEDCAEEDGTVYVVMEYLEGQELTTIIREQGRLAPERAQKIALQTLEAMQEAHRLGVIHRDIKPNNIFICRDDQDQDFVKVLDFGIAKVAAGGTIKETTRLTVSGGVMGTPPYMSPEQCRGETLTPASDIYSLGIVLYELLVGHTPFDDDNPTVVLMMQCQDAPPPFPQEIANTALCVAVMRALAKDPQQRFSTAADFRDAILGKEVPLPKDKPLPSLLPGTASPAPSDAVAPTPAPTVALSSKPTAAPAASAPVASPATASSLNSANVPAKGLPMAAIIGGVVALIAVIGVAVAFFR